MAKRLIPPNLVREHYINYTGHDPGAGSAALNDRYEDPQDDEFWYGLAAHINNIRVNQNKTIATLTAQIAELGKRPTAEQLAALQQAVADAEAEEAAAEKELAEALEKQKSDAEAGESVLRRLGQFIKKFLPGGE